jgi:hypothetical protein
MCGLPPPPPIGGGFVFECTHAENQQLQTTIESDARQMRRLSQPLWLRRLVWRRECERKQGRRSCLASRLACACPAPPDSTWAYAFCFRHKYLAAFRALQMLSVNPAFQDARVAGSLAPEHFHCDSTWRHTRPNTYFRLSALGRARYISIATVVA